MRDDSVSIAKGIGIILMVLAHSGFSRFGDAVINMFHMPLFFFLSGYCFNDKHLLDAKHWFIGKIQRLWLPYVTYSFLFLLFHNILFRLHIYECSYEYNDFIFRAVRIPITMGMHEQLLGGYWFIGALFWGLIIAYLLLRIFHNKAIIGCCVSLFIAIIMSAFNVRIPIICLSYIKFYAAAFILMGVYYKRQNFSFESGSRFIIVILSAAVLILLGTFYWRGCVPIIETWKIIPYFITAVMGAIAVFLIAKRLVNVAKFIKHIGDNTLGILTWHFSCFKIVSLLIIALYKLPIENLNIFPVLSNYAERWWWVVYFVVGIGLSLLINHFISICILKIKSIKSF